MPTNTTICEFLTSFIQKFSTCVIEQDFFLKYSTLLNLDNKKTSRSPQIGKQIPLNTQYIKWYIFFINKIRKKLKIHNAIQISEYSKIFKISLNRHNGVEKSIAMDQKIILLLQSQKIEAIHLLYDNYSAIMYGTILRIVHTHDVAEEVLQDCFIKVWKNSSSYDPSKGKLATWLINIARNSAIDKTRTTSWKNCLKNTDLSAATNIAQSFVVPEHIDLHKIVDTLKPKHKVLIDMVYFQGYTQNEISEKLNLPLGTIKTRIRSALEDLRSIFNVVHPSLTTPSNAG